MRESPYLAAALDYAKRGWHVFPCHSINKTGHCTCKDGPKCEHPGKHPLVAGGFHAATTDPNKIRSWWGKWPWANVAIATGKVSGLVVLDIDPRNGGDLDKLPGNLPLTPTVETGGGGLHYYFQYPEDQDILSIQSLFPGVDVKADGGYVIAPPSRHISSEHYSYRVKP
jgi:putative DNA primase/helicase